MRHFAVVVLALLPGLLSAQVLTRVVAVDADQGGFLDGITIQLQPVDSSNPVVEAVTTSAGGSAGTATFADIAPGTYYAFATPSSGYATPTALRLDAGQFVAALSLRRFDSEGGRLEGVVTDAERGVVLRFARLAFASNRASGDSLRFASADADGRYAIPIGTGSFDGEVVVRDPGPDGEQAGYTPLALSLTVPDGAVPLDLAFTAVRRGTLSGVVTDAESDQPLEGATVSATSANGDQAVATVNADGTYAVDVPVGTYVVRAQTLFGDYVAEFYDDVTAEAAATPLTVGEGDVLSGIDFALSPAGAPFSVTVEGTILSDDGGPAGGVTVSLFSASGSVIAQDSTGADGTYRMVSRDALASNSEVRVCFLSPLYVSECYDNASALDDATPLATGSEPIVFTNIDAEVTGFPQGAIAGRVTDEATGEGLSQVSVRSSPVDGGVTTFSTTDANGDFRFDTLVGDYILSALPTGPYVSEFYEDAQTLSDATPITVTDGGTTTGIDIALARVADDFSITIEGTVTDSEGEPVSGAVVSVLDPEQRGAGGMVSTGTDGRYRFSTSDTRLAGTSLTVLAADTTQAGSRFQFYDGQPSFELADRLETGSEAVSFTEIDLVLTASEEDLDGFAVSGVVHSDATEGPLNAATVMVVRIDAPGFRAVTTNADGSYRLDGLAPGTYAVLFTARGHTPVFYPDAGSWEEGELLSLGSDTGDVDGTLSLLASGDSSQGMAPFVVAPTLLGAVTSASGPLRGALVVARDPSGAATAFALTDDTGEFEIQSLTPESVQLQVDLPRYAVERRTLNPGSSVHFVTLTSKAATAGEPAPEADGLSLSVAPNPVQGRTTVAYTLAVGGDVRMAVYDALGREVAVLASGRQAEGPHAVPLDTTSLATGVYVVRLSASGEAASTWFTIVR